MKDEQKVDWLTKWFDDRNRDLKQHFEDTLFNALSDVQHGLFPEVHTKGITYTIQDNDGAGNETTFTLYQMGKQNDDIRIEM